MKCTDWFIDADTHVTEPGDVWTARLPRKFLEDAPRMIRTDDGVDLFWADQAMGPPTGIVHRSTLVMGMVNSPFVTDQDSPWDVAVDTTNVYWANHGSAGTADGSIMFQTK